MMLRFEVSRAVGDETFIDAIELERCGLLRILGWSRTPHDQVASRLSVAVNDCPREFLQHYWHVRHDVPATPAAGICVEYELGTESVTAIRVRAGSMSIFERSGFAFRCEPPHYQHVRATTRVLHREQIYCSGPQSSNPSQEVLQLASGLKGPLLDFGCGGGAVLRRLLAAGVDARGLDVDCASVRTAVPEELLPFVTLTDGTFPTPFGDRQFQSVFCSEVLEHVPDYETAVFEIARVCRGECLITVPDAGAIPTLHKQHVVPWHLLEGTHVNFFTQASLSRLLTPYFNDVSIGRTGLGSVNGTSYWDSLVAHCRAPRSRTPPGE